jgi:hypothetical protein
MAVKKPVRRKRNNTRGRFDRVLKTIRTNRWTGTSGISVAAAFAVLVGVLVFAYTTAPTPAAPDRTGHAATRTIPAAAATGSVATAASDDTARHAEAIADTNIGRADADGDMPKAVTLTGCLARSDNEFRLKDTTGANAPKARSWKSGFLTKRSAQIAVVPEGPLPLSTHVGHRVRVSGTLVDREMRVRTLRSVSASCDDAPRVKA